MSNFIPNSFQIPNIIIDEYLHTLSDFELRVYLIIIRKTKGWHKEKDNIAISQFIKLLKIKDPRTIKKAIKGLVKLNLIKKIENVGKESTFSINLDFNPIHADVVGHEHVPPTCSCNNPIHADAGGPPTSLCTPQSNNKNNKQTTTTSSSKKNKLLEEWLTQKSKNKLNPSAYKADLVKKLKEKSVIDEYNSWHETKFYQDALESARGKTIQTANGIKTILTVEPKDGKLHVFFKEGSFAIIPNITALEKITKAAS
ncbi:replication protein [Sulfurimonas sp.]|uniref:replication protein n=1 Tax=Sulfurimonas sp. TaxID=2022749 RepID=UPI0025D0CF6F|nr:replication protein [Sulfurimonas sp.]